MSSPISPEEICNLSLDLLRHNEQITSIETPESDVEGLASRWYDGTRRALLRMFPWNFARTRKTLARNSVAPEFGYADSYNLPGDYCGIVFLGDDLDDVLNKDYLVEGGQILIDNNGSASLQICYVKDIQDITKFEPIFLMLLVGELAVVFGNAISGLNKSIKGMELFRDRWEAKARAKNGHENRPRIRYESPILNARKSAQRATGSDGIHLFS